jgi:hypothetical protein
MKQRINNGQCDERDVVPMWRNIGGTHGDNGVPSAHHAKHDHREKNVFVLDRREERARRASVRRNVRRRFTSVVR